MHSQFRARPFVVGVLGLRTGQGVPCDCWYCCFYDVDLVWSPEGSYVVYLLLRCLFLFRRVCILDVHLMRLRCSAAL